MPVYAKKVQSTNSLFHDRATSIITPEMVKTIPILDSVTLCNGCNQNIDEGYLVYLGKRELKANQPYDYYCDGCLKRYFKGAVMMED